MIFQSQYNGVIRYELLSEFGDLDIRWKKVGIGDLGPACAYEISSHSRSPILLAGSSQRLHSKGTRVEPNILCPGLDETTKLTSR